MKKFLSLFVVLFLLGACAQAEDDDYYDDEDYEEDYEDDNEADMDYVEFIPNSPVVTFDTTTLERLGINLSGSDTEIAQGIYDWQIENMNYVAFGPISDAMRWNYMLPGIYTTLEMLDVTNSEGKIEGLCYNFATIYCSIADGLGLDCRVAQMAEKPSELDSSIDPKTTTGLGPDEYARLEKLLNSKGYNYDYELIRSIAKETSAHYHAEVLIDGEWKVYDASTYFVGDEYNKTYEFYEVDWLEGFEDDIVNP